MRAVLGNWLVGRIVMKHPDRAILFTMLEFG